MLLHCEVVIRDHFSSEMGGTLADAFYAASRLCFDSPSGSHPLFMSTLGSHSVTALAAGPGACVSRASRCHEPDPSPILSESGTLC